MSWSDPIDIYCERTDPGFWSEPLNALTNAALLLAALVALWRYREARLHDPYLVVLIAIIALIGAGSFAFHTLATRGAALLDIIPIALFVYGYLWLALHRFVGLSFLICLLIVGAFIAVSQGLSAMLPRHLLNGSLEYLPPLVALYAVGYAAQNETARRGILTAAVAFTLSLVLRTVDIAACGILPAGTHFVWHLLNAWVLYKLIATAITVRASAAQV